MPVRTIDGVEIEVDDEGYFRHSGDWNQRMAPILAHEAGIDRLTPAHWRVIDFIRALQFESGSAPNMRLLERAPGVSNRELRQLFRRAPAEVAAKIAGVPKPRVGV